MAFSIRLCVLVAVAVACAARAFPTAEDGLCDICKLEGFVPVCVANPLVNPYLETLLNACWAKCNHMGDVRHKGECCARGEYWCANKNGCINIGQDCCQSDADCGSGLHCCAGLVVPGSLTNTTSDTTLPSTCSTTCPSSDCLATGGCSCANDRDCGNGQFCCGGKCAAGGVDCCAANEDCGHNSVCCDSIAVTLFDGSVTKLPKRCASAASGCPVPKTPVSGVVRCVDSEECGDHDWNCGWCKNETTLEHHCCNYEPLRFSLDNIV
eukprot:Opistho-2@57749